MKNREAKPVDGWEIYPSCDISLGTLFIGDDAPLKGYEINVNADVIRDNIVYLQGEHRTNEDLIFHVTCPDDIDEETESKGYGGFFGKKDGEEIGKPGKDIPTCVIVLPKTSNNKQRSPRDIADIITSRTQKISIHELCHAADNSNERLRGQDRRYRRAAQIGRNIVDFCIEMSPLTDSFRTRLKKYNNETYRYLTDKMSPMERRAYKTSHLAQDLPAAVTISPRFIDFDNLPDYAPIPDECAVLE